MITTLKLKEAKDKLVDTITSLDILIAAMTDPYKKEKMTLLFNSKVDLQLVGNMIDERIENYDDEDEMTRVKTFVRILEIQEKVLKSIKLVEKITVFGMI